MKFLNFTHGGKTALGAQLADGSILDLSDVGSDVDALMEGGQQALDAAARLIAEVDSGKSKAARISFDAATILPPVRTTGRNIFCVGRNYKDHIIEGNIANGRPANAFPEAIEFFTKPRTALVGHRGKVMRHAKLTDSLDYEVELAIVIGKGGRDIRREDALGHVFGYSVLNDITARNLQKKHGQWFKGKALDTSCPLGPVIVHASAIADPGKLQLELDIDGDMRQSDNTSDMLFDVAAVIEQLSAGMSLECGDVIATGTPKGVGFAQKPPRCMEVGQTVNARIAGIGELSNLIVAS
jgi:2-keto-4-pentenoate hydratase/2-oxohepta-3-ene-1,7-dioic acid hydratase in catechol pathway